jgi:hypothetical protein
MIYGSAQATYKSVNQSGGNYEWVTSQFETKKSANALAYDPTNPSTVYLGFSK